MGCVSEPLQLEGKLPLGLSGPGCVSKGGPLAQSAAYASVLENSLWVLTLGRYGAPVTEHRTQTRVL